MYKLDITVLHDGTVSTYSRGITIEYSSLKDVLIPDDVSRVSIVSYTDLSIDITDVIGIHNDQLKELFLNTVDVSPLNGVKYNNLTTLRMASCINTLDDRIDLSGCPALGLLHVIDTRIGLLPDITACTELCIVVAQRSDLSNDSLNNLDLSALEQMQFFIIDHCLIQGVLPEYIQHWSKLLALSLQYNMLTGGIPQSYSKLAKLKRLSLSGNKLEGDISVITTLNELFTLNLPDSD